MSDAPQGTVTFLFTDIVGSTRLWEKFSDLMGRALGRHDALMRQAAAKHGGHVFKTVGDAFCIAFSTPRAALDAAVEAQRSLASEDWGDLGPLLARMGVHTGTAEFRDDDYFGGTLNRVARIQAAAHGGQILLSQVTQGLLEDDHAPSVTFQSLGSHRLRNLDRPEFLFQVVAPGLIATFPPPRTLEVLPNNLPLPTSSFVGREREIEEVRHFLSAGRLLTLIGTGGTGKTRLALEVAAQLIPSFPDGVWLVELAPIAEPGQIVEVTAAAVGARGEPDRPLRETLINFLRSKKILLVFDNCEHLLSDTARLVGDLLRVCPNLKVLATSRHSLGLAGEVTFPVPPLGMLDVRMVTLSGPDMAAKLSQFDAVKLFIQRAVAVRPDFVVTNTNAPALAEICSRLDGIPLAIELAAARARVLDLDQIAERLDDRFRLLRTGGTGSLPHQQTLQALIDWSHDLLSEPERILFRRLGVFVGGRTIEALEVVGPGEGVSAGDVLDLLQQLIEKSLVTVEHEAGSAPRYTMIESVWHYAREKLETSGELDVLKNRHLNYFLQFVENAAPHLEGPRQVEWLNRCQREIFNLRYAWDWCVRSLQAESGFRLLTALARFLEIRGNLEETRTVVQQLLALKDEDVAPDVRAGFLVAAGRFAWAADRDGEARDYYTAGREIYIELGDAGRAARTSALLGFLDCAEQKIEDASHHFQEALDVGRSHGIPGLEALGLVGLGTVAQDRGDLSRARELKEAGLAIHERQGDLWVICLVLWSLTQVAIAQGDSDRAATALAQWSRITRELGNRWALPFILDRYAELALGLGQALRAVRLFSAADGMRTHFGEPLPPRALANLDKALMQLRSLLSEREFQDAWEEGRTASPWDLIEAP